MFAHSRMKEWLAILSFQLCIDREEPMYTKESSKIGNGCHEGGIHFLIEWPQHAGSLLWAVPNLLAIEKCDNNPYNDHRRRNCSH